MTGDDRRVIEFQAFQLGSQQLLESKLSRACGYRVRSAWIIGIRLVDYLFFRKINDDHVLTVQGALDRIDYDRSCVVLQHQLVLHILELDLLSRLLKSIRPGCRCTATTTTSCRRWCWSSCCSWSWRRRLQCSRIAEPFFKSGLVHLVCNEGHGIGPFGKDSPQSAGVIPMVMR